MLARQSASTAQFQTGFHFTDGFIGMGEGWGPVIVTAKGCQLQFVFCGPNASDEHSFSTALALSGAEREQGKLKYYKRGESKSCIKIIL